jgi:hypothetical protein
MRTAPATSVASTSALPHPAAPLRTSAHTRLSAAAVTSAIPVRSSGATGPRDSASRTRHSAIATSPIGTLTQKIQCQSIPWVIAPPITGPAAIARPPIAPQRPTTAPRRSAGNAAVSKVSDSGMIAAAPMPWTARAASSKPTVGASAHPAEAALNTASPAMNIWRRPSRSPRAAAVMIPAAYVRLYALTVHSSVETPACS